MPDEFLTVAEIAERLKLNAQTVRNWIDQGELPAVWAGARRVRVRASDLDAFLAAIPARRLQLEKGDPWRPVSQAVRAVSRAVRQQDRDALTGAIAELQSAAETLPD